ncbi:MAG: DNA polymerase III subunit gamma/tau [Candidatus Cloacimonas sp.]|jgi:DNA polymerase-3 subunit gamma/tau|nr:DNA polymerase III subunit gamma/tau [Candidatus Cloacimonas sp.]
MSYIVLARKYRPQNFKEVYAQDHVTEILQSAISSGRIAHAYLFTGPRGVGKTSLARIMAKSLNCVHGPTTDPCNKCSNCMEITAGTSTDVIEIDGASNTGVDDIRELQRELLYAASGAKYKIYIIDEVHMLSKNAFNALLKTLEEPPENVIFIFATTEPHKVLPTIISRCQRYDFKRIPIEAIVQRIKDLSVVEGIKIDNESMYLIARKADGGMRDALSLLDQAISYCLNNITIERVRLIFGLIPNQVYYRFLTLINAKDAKGLITELHAIFEQGTDLQEFIANMQEFIRVLILRKLGVQIKDINPEELPIFDELGTMYAQDKLLYMMSFLIGCRADLKSSSNPFLILETMMIKFCKMDEMDDLAAMIAKLNSGTALQSTIATSPAPQQNVQSAKTTSPYRAPEPIIQEEPELPKVDFNSENLEKTWARIIARMRKISGMGALALEKVTDKEAKSRSLYLTVDTQTGLNTLKANQEKIQVILNDLFHQDLLVEFKLIDGVTPTQVQIKRRTIDDIKAESPELAKFIENTDSILS